ncbi:hypothetical protein WOLCODRAFT_160999 [Wolfiporia cocos MD-104 SS10]|uniref:Inositol-pentakisphosphate 2-kinase n=1 Tax=Wolfiporia cocos (strain MD-104) TaxID=742152 RepID=A0A2H3JJ08_WOLCO|nr:hypothetical protein WOLCODRAFT_160999 [Wolfiporia cocos MD-104 SS10]
MQIQSDVGAGEVATTIFHVLSQTSPEYWRYVAEGGATCVFSYIGPPHSMLDGTVLRLRKIRKDQILDADRTTVMCDPNEAPGDAQLFFQRNVIQRLVPPEHLPRLEIVHLDQTWLNQLIQLHDEARPPLRRLKDEIDRRSTTAILATDLVRQEGLAVEIKPKWGFLPSATYLSPQTRTVKMRTCRFCMHTHLRSAQGEKAATEYCPLDLYSCDEPRVRRSLHALWEHWVGNDGEINNLRIFVKGKNIVPSQDAEKLHAISGLFDVASDTSHNASSLDEIRNRFIDTLIPIVLHSPVLSLLSRLQRTLDPLDVEGLAGLWSRAHSELTPEPSLGQGLAEPSEQLWAHFVDEYNTRLASLEKEYDEPRPQAHELEYYCMAYMLSATFKDCSIIINLAGKDAKSVKVIDLDVKSISRLEKWDKLDREIVSKYAMLDTPKTCVDRWAKGGQAEQCNALDA